MFKFKILEVTKENENEYIDEIATLEEKVLQDMESKGKIGQLFITGKEDILEYVNSKDNSVLIALDENNNVRAATYITQNQMPFTYNDITKYFKYGDDYKKYVKSLYKSNEEYQRDMLVAYGIKLKAYKYGANRILKEYPQYNTIIDFLENELNDKQNRFHEKSVLRELINKYMSEYIQENSPEYKQLYERFYWTNAKDIQDETNKTIDINNLKNTDVKEYEEFINGEKSKEHTKILEQGKLKVYYGCENMQNYYTANTQNSVEIDTYITDPENRQYGLARALVFEGIKKHIQRHFSNPNNSEIFLCSTLHKNNLSSKYVSEFFGLKDTIFVNRRKDRDREVHICKISKEDSKQYLEHISKKIAVLYGYNPEEKAITKQEEMKILQEQLEYEKEELARLKRVKKKKGKKFKAQKEILKGKQSKINKIKNKINNIRKEEEKNYERD